MNPEFRAGERNVTPPRLTCTECGGRAEGNVAWSDGSGEICDACSARMQREDDVTANGDRADFANEVA